MLAGALTGFTLDEDGIRSTVVEDLTSTFTLRTLDNVLVVFRWLLVIVLPLCSAHTVVVVTHFVVGS